MRVCVFVDGCEVGRLKICVCVRARSRTAFSFSVYKQTCKRVHDNGYPRFKHMHRYVSICRMHECACMNMYSEAVANAHSARVTG